MSQWKQLAREGLWSNNPALVQLLGLCPLLAVSASVVNALGLALATLLVLVGASTTISLIRPSGTQRRPATRLCDGHCRLCDLRRAVNGGFCLLAVSNSGHIYSADCYQLRHFRPRRCVCLAPACATRCH